MESQTRTDNSEEQKEALPIFNSEKRCKFNQYKYIFSVSLLCISCGNCLGYTSPAVLTMQEDKNFPALTPLMISWIGGICPLGACIGSLLVIFPNEFYGVRKTILRFGAPSFIISWAIIAAADNYVMVLIGRFLGGIGVGVVISLCPLYVLQIAGMHRRGRLGVIPQFLMISGIFLSYVLGCFLNWRNLAIVSLIVPILSIITLCKFATDSPKQLVNEGNSVKALEVLKTIRKSGEEAEIELRELENNKKCKIIQENSDPGNQNQDKMKPKSNLLNKLKSPGLIPSSLTALGVITFQQFSGINGVTFYAVNVFSQTMGEDQWGGPHLPSILLSLVQMIASFSSTFLIERAGRKFLLLISSVLVASTTFSLALYFHFSSLETPSCFFWVPLMLLIIYSFGFSFGLGPVAWIVVAEYLQEEVRRLLNPICIAFNWICVMMITFSFPLLQEIIGTEGIFFLYSLFSGLGVLFFIFCPETKGKSILEIRQFFISGKNGNKSDNSIHNHNINNNITNSKV